MSEIYRIREARVQVCNGYNCWRERKFIAERHVKLFRLLSWWSPVTNAEWRETSDAAKRDAERDAKWRSPLAAPELYRIE